MQVQSNSQNAQVTGAIQQAAKTTGANFDYLLTTAQIESNLNPNAKAATSTAQGLFQFIDQTWFATMKQAGPALGYSRLADAIVQGPDGRFEVPDPFARNTIMQLRSDPKVSAMLAGVFTRSNAAQLTGQLGRTPSEGELYIAHFLGPDGASRLINAAVTNPYARAADVFPSAAAANRTIFYDRAGNGRSLIDVYRVLTDKYELARAGTNIPDSSPPAQSLDTLRGSLAAGEAPLRPPASIPIPTNPNPVQDTAGIAKAFADANVRPQVIDEAKPLFQAMFRSRGDEPVGTAVRNLWSQTPSQQGSSQQVPNQQVPAQQAPVESAQSASSFNLFSDPLRPTKP